MAQRLNASIVSPDGVAAIGVENTFRRAGSITS